jgi:ubiquinone/menaquinone biosynthesis C-methylase UbiE
MEAPLEQIRDVQKETWNRSSSGWKKWDEITMDFLKPAGDAIIRMLQPEGNDRVLDIAAGTGEPGLTIATMLNGGKVIITDLAEDMLAIAREKAGRMGIKNIETVACDVSELPFDDNSFDAISCRMGFMFFPDMLMATEEMVRVLKPGGRVAAAVWNKPKQNPWFTIPMSSTSKHMSLPAPAPGAPGMFRCAEDGLMAGIFSKAGLKNIAQQEVEGMFKSGSVDQYWGFASECIGPVVNALSKADDSLRQKIKDDVYQTVHDNYANGRIMMSNHSVVVYGEK